MSMATREIAFDDVRAGVHEAPLDNRFSCSLHCRMLSSAAGQRVFHWHQ
jgi:hypothetical protein